MTGFGFLLVAVAGLGFAALDWMRKSLTLRLAAVPLLWALSLGAVPLHLAWWWQSGWGAVTDGYWPPALSSLALNVGANLLFLQAVRIGSLSATIPLLSLTPVFTALLAVPLLNERLLPRQWGGILIVVAGALALQGVEHRSRRKVNGSRTWLGGALMATVAVVWSTTTPLDKLAMAAAPPAFHALLLNGGIALVLTAVMGLQRHSLRSREPSGGFPMVLLVATVIVGAVALGAQLVALREIPAGLLETLKRGIGCLSAVLVGWWRFGEVVSWAKLVAVLFIIVGVAELLG